MIGVLANIVFVASSNRVFTFNDMSRDRSIRTAEHEVIGRKPVLEFIGENLANVSFNMRLDRGLGVSPKEEIERLYLLMKNGVICPLLLGYKFMGDYLIEEISESFDHVYKDGSIVRATISIKLKEYN